MALTVWFKRQVKEHGEQLRRIVRYLKAWADFQTGRKGKMPCGLILTVLAVQNFRAAKRDDVSMAETAIAITSAVSSVFCVYNPVDSQEDLTARLTDEQKKRFRDAMTDLSSCAAKAVEMDDLEKASRAWRSEFGDRFPLVEKQDTDEQKQKDASTLAAAYIAKKPAKPWGFF